MTFTFRSRRDIQRIRKAVRQSEGASRNRGSIGGGLKQGAASTSRHDPDRILIRNESSTDVDRFGVLGINEPFVLPADDLLGFKDTLMFRGVEPSCSEHQGKFCILEEAIPAGETGWALVSGMIKCQVEIVEAADLFADIHDGRTNRLISNVTGSAQIIWKDEPDENNIAWCVVRLSNVDESTTCSSTSTTAPPTTTTGERPTTTTGEPPTTTTQGPTTTTAPGTTTTAPGTTTTGQPTTTTDSGSTTTSYPGTTTTEGGSTTTTGPGTTTTEPGTTTTEGGSTTTTGPGTTTTQSGTTTTGPGTTTTSGGTTTTQTCPPGFILLSVVTDVNLVTVDGEKTIQVCKRQICVPDDYIGVETCENIGCCPPGNGPDLTTTTAPFVPPLP